MGVDGGLHADGAQQLQGVVLHHVAQRTCGLIKRTALFHAEFFGNGDLDVGDVFTPPEWFKQGIAKTQGKQVLYRWFAQVVVNAKHLLLTEDLSHAVVDRPVAGQVVAQRFLQHHTGLRCVQAGAGQLLDDGGEKRGCGGQVHHHRVGRTLRQFVLQVNIVCRLGQVHADKFEQPGKALKLLRAGAFSQFHLVKTAQDQRAVAFITEVISAHADDARTRGQGAVFEGLKQRGHQLAPGQVARAAKENKVKTHVRKGRFRLRGKTKKICNVTWFHNIS